MKRVIDIKKNRKKESLSLYEIKKEKRNKISNSHSRLRNPNNIYNLKTERIVNRNKSKSHNAKFKKDKFYISTENSIQKTSLINRIKNKKYLEDNKIKNNNSFDKNLFIILKNKKDNLNKITNNYQKKENEKMLGRKRKNKNKSPEIRILDDGSYSKSTDISGEKDNLEIKIDKTESDILLIISVYCLIG